MAVTDTRRPLRTSATRRSVLERYTREDGELRNLVIEAGPERSLLVIDERIDGEGDERLVTQLAPDEPFSNALLICADYLSDPQRRWCRPVQADDRERLPDWASTSCGSRDAGHDSPPAAAEAQTLVGRDGSQYRLAPVSLRTGGVADQRWVRQPAPPSHGPVEVVSLRRVVAACESYEPARSMTLLTVAARARGNRESVATLSAELQRMAVSPIVLNRGLREAVERAVAGGVSMSLIAIRCGRVKRDQRGNVSGETSWLGRRLGLLGEAGSQRPTPWIHTDVLALIARRGLGISPREVELG